MSARETEWRTVTVVTSPWRKQGWLGSHGNRTPGADVHRPDRRRADVRGSGEVRVWRDQGEAQVAGCVQALAPACQLEIAAMTPPSSDVAVQLSAGRLLVLHNQS